MRSFHAILKGKRPMSMSTPVLRGKGMARDDELTETDKLLAIKFPHLKKSWLARINRKLALLKQDDENGGNVEMVARFSHFSLKWLGWNEREELRD
jgi:hypothetical protein